VIVGSPLADGAGQATNTTLLLLGAAFLGWLAVRRLRGAAMPWLPRPGAWAGVGLAVAIAAVALVLPSLTSPGPTARRPSSTARIEILSPRQGQVFTAPSDRPIDVAVRLEVLGARIVPATSSRLRSDEGHVHLFLDGALISMTGGATADTRVGPGSHVLTAEFVASDHGPFDPRVRVAVRFSVLTG
jgi:hypothetical protein